jgi:hypothetical protein
VDDVGNESLQQAVYPLKHTSEQYRPFDDWHFTGEELKGNVLPRSGVPISAPAWLPQVWPLELRCHSTLDRAFAPEA